MQKIIAFSPEIAKEIGDIPSAIYYQQLHFWSDKGSRKDGFIYKTKKEIEQETTLTRDQQDRIRKKLEKKGWIETKKLRANGAPTLHYKCLKKLTLVISGKPAIGNVGNPPLETWETRQSITEITTENTTDNNILQSKDCEREKECNTTEGNKSQELPLVEFDFQEKISSMVSSADRRMIIIALYWRAKKFQFENKKQYDSALKRELRPAGTLVGYSNKQIIDTMLYLQKQDFKWTLETVHKYIDDLPKALIPNIPTL